ncbi:Nn.00g003720.m01.CDS01 [Neocucurbitaria sp. VM-36]
MPPKVRPGRARYKEGRDYFKAAYRERIKELHGGVWTNAQITSTLAWLWLHASDEEKQRSIDLQASKSQQLPTVDEASIPDEPKTTADLAPTRADSVRRADGDDEEAQGGGHDDLVNENGPRGASTKTEVNTTAFAYLPDLKTLNDTLPGIEESDEDEDEEKRDAKKRRWLEAGLCYPDKDRLSKKWYGAYMLGKGATGRVGLWVGSNDMKFIEDRLAVRDVFVDSPDRWINPVYWRDRLPREIAVQIRLNEQKGYNHHIHRYYAHRVNFWQRRYRIFNEICDLGNLLNALDWYSRAWRRRSNRYRWIYNHPNITAAMDAVEMAEGWSGSEKMELVQARRKAWKRFLRQKKRTRGDNYSLSTDTADHLRYSDQSLTGHTSNEDDPYYYDYEAMSGLSDWHDEDLPEELPEVIPESFLWTVFDQLVDAFSVMGTGSVEDDGKKAAWNEIVHRDVHLMNIFVKPSNNVTGTPVESDVNYRFERFKAKDAPSVVLADFDYAFFDLQTGNDLYADNPQHYILRQSPLEIPVVGGRYPPEMYWNYEGHQDDEEPWEKMTSKTDVWAIGQIMWNLVMNLPGKGGRLNEPFFHFTDRNDVLRKQKLVNGKPYDIIAHKAHLFSGLTPYEASHFYSDTLKDVIFLCLDYRQHKRWTFAKLKSVTEEYAGKEAPAGSQAHGDVVIKIPREMEKFAIGGKYEWPLDRKGKFKRQRQSEEIFFDDPDSSFDSAFGDSI